MLDELIPLVDVPEGKKGPWTVERFTVSKKDADFFNLRQIIARQGGRRIMPGTYTRLIREKAWDPMMSDTPAERWDHYAVVKLAKGRVLVAGLGLGVVLNALLRKSEIQHVTILEKDADVIALVAPHYQAKANGRLTIVHADVFEWVPPKGERWDVVWFDIWPNMCEDHLPEMTRLKRKFARRAAWKGCWCEREMRR